jgi:hypothetical protein
MNTTQHLYGVNITGSTDVSDFHAIIVAASYQLPCMEEECGIL